MADLAEPEVIDPEALRLIVNATLIARYGLPPFRSEREVPNMNADDFVAVTASLRWSALWTKPAT